MTTANGPAPAPRPLRVACVDAVALAEHGLAYLARRYPDLRLVGAAAGPQGARSLVVEAAADVVTVGDVLPDGPARLVAELRARYPDLGLVVMAHQLADERAGAMRQAGASAFVSRTAPVPAVVSAIRHAGTAPRSFRTFGVQRAPGPLLADSGSEGSALSVRERQVLEMLSQGHSHAAIGDTLGIREGTVRTYVARIYRKLQVRNRSQALVATFGGGPG